MNNQTNERGLDMRDIKLQDTHGKFVLLSIMPGWLMTGCIIEETETSVVLSPATWIENVSDSFTKALNNPKVMNSAHHMDKITVNKANINFVATCSEGAAVAGSSNAIMNTK